MNFLITGANGFIGKHFVNKLQSLNIKVFTVGRSPVPGLENSFFSIDEINEKSFVNFLIEIDIDYFVNLTGNSNINNIKLNNFVNCDVGLILLEKIIKLYPKKEVRFVLFGSSAEYGRVGDANLPINELEKTDPINIYGKAKLKQTQNAILKNNKLKKILIIRPFSIIGERMSKNSIFGSVINQINNKNQKFIKTGNLHVYRDFIDIRNFIDFTYKLIIHHESYGKVVNVCSGRPVFLKEMIEFIISNFNNSKKIKQIKNSDFDKVPQKFYGDNSLMISLIGQSEMIHWKQSLIRVLSNE